MLDAMSCISFESYIKPQHTNDYFGTPKCCISFESYIKPQRGADTLRMPTCCISFESYIKPQPSAEISWVDGVVYLLNPTSNHNTVR